MTRNDTDCGRSRTDTLPAHEPRSAPTGAARPVRVSARARSALSGLALRLATWAEDDQNHPERISLRSTSSPGHRPRRPND
ncbi:hypothetical protein ACIRS1_05580 [Kitasatospora sp. NPDC101176]|uniref:hypothetical protein n=1 Tax=Kitasatospora sp. NPDC101176 TaxID=3364099 RepID=UPI0038000466